MFRPSYILLHPSYILHTNIIETRHVIKTFVTRPS